MLNIDDAIDYAYLKVQFPAQVTGFKAGFPMEAQTDGAGRMNMQAWEMGRDAKGQCSVIQAAIDNKSEVQGSAAGNMFEMHMGKLPTKSSVMVAVSVSDTTSSVQPIPRTFTEGFYEYIELGQLVRKRLKIDYRGISEAK
jgi:hypothetical protein